MRRTSQVLLEPWAARTAKFLLTTPESTGWRTSQTFDDFPAMPPPPTPRPPEPLLSNNAPTVRCPIDVVLNRNNWRNIFTDPPSLAMETQPFIREMANTDHKE